MATTTYEKEITAVVVIDRYNDFISEGGKVWSRIKGVAEANNCVPHMWLCTKRIIQPGAPILSIRLHNLP